MVSSEYIREQERKSAEGERLEALMSSGVLEELVLKPIEQEAFIAFTKMPPEEVSAITQTQQAYKAVNKIRRRIAGIIEEGKKARHELINTLPENSDE